METFIIPDLHCPIPPAINPGVEAAQQHVQEWAQTFGLVQDEAALERFNKARFAWLISRTYPLADAEALDTVVQFNAWLFLLDDFNDESECSRQPAQLRRLHAQLFAVLQGEGTASADDPFSSSLADVWHRIAGWAAPAWKARFLQHVSGYFNACQWEAQNREQRRIPTVQAYIAARALTGAMQTAFDWAFLTENITLPDAVRDHPAVEALALACTNTVCFANDVYSCHKEKQAGDVHNLVVVLHHQGMRSWQDALDHAARLHDAEMQKFLALEQHLARYEWASDQNLRRYVGVMRSWIRGNFDWSRETGRYFQPTTAQAVSPAFTGTPVR